MFAQCSCLCIISVALLCVRTDRSNFHFSFFSHENEWTHIFQWILIIFVLLIETMIGSFILSINLMQLIELDQFDWMTLIEHKFN